ncbi:MAG: methyltransferase domain-containing protein [Candidatus Bathyarchaeota archaeon]|nr:methyltransferase domain-containing protein [Candidatus Bathyarchaeota archaeon]
MATWKEKRKIMQRYDLTAEMYDERYAEEQRRKYCETLREIDVTGKVILDVGCGSGLLFGQVATKAEMIVGVDVSRNLLAKAKVNGRDFGNVFVVQADADFLPFTDGFFIVVFAFTVLQNLPKPALTLSELWRVVRLEGLVVVTGLKKAFGLENFMDLLENSGLRLVSFVDDDSLNCYVAVLGAA